MHDYTWGLGGRLSIYAGLSVPAVAVGLAGASLVHSLGFDPPWWTEAPGLLTIYGLCFAVYDRWIWKFKLGPLKLSFIPRVDGLWYGYLVSSHKQEVVHKGVISVQQTWSSVSICLETSNSRSESQAASLGRRSSGEPVINYLYFNRPFTLRGADLSPHAGAACHWIEDNTRLEGEYYSASPRHNHGEIFMARAPLGSHSLAEVKRQWSLDELPAVELPLGALAELTQT